MVQFKEAIQRLSDMQDCQNRCLQNNNYVDAYCIAIRIIKLQSFINTQIAIYKFN